MNVFDPARHPRTTTGQFTETNRADPGPILDNHTGFDTPDWTTATWTPTDEDPDIVELDGPGWLYATGAYAGRRTYTTADYDLPLERDRYEWTISDARTGAELASGVTHDLTDAKRACQRAWFAISS